MNAKVRMSKFKLTSWSILLEIILLARSSEQAGLDDNEIVFKINWPGKSTADFVVRQRLSDTVRLASRATIKFLLLISHVCYFTNYNCFQDTQTNAEPYVITTANNEKYQCIIPDTAPQKNEYTEKFHGADPMEFLQPLFSKDICNFKVFAQT